MRIFVGANEGYRLDDKSTEYYLDGKKTKLQAASLYYAIFTKGYVSETAKVINKVELKINKPNVGDHTSVLPTVTVVSGKGLAVLNDEKRGVEPDWLQKYNGQNMPASGYFEEGHDYGVGFYLVADKGYAFSDDLLVVINGIAVPADEIFGDAKSKRVEYFFSMTCAHVYDNEADGTCDVCGFVRYNETVPNTGDNLPLDMSIALMLGAVAVTGFATYKRKMN